MFEWILFYIIQMETLTPPQVFVNHPPPLYIAVIYILFMFLNIALSEPLSLISVITAVMLIGLNHSLDCIVHNDEEEWASILRSISI